MSNPYKLKPFGVAIGMPSISGPSTERRPRFESLINPWFHGPDNFRGKVDTHYDPHHGYKGPYPGRGEKAEEGKRVDTAHFKGDEERDGRGHATKPKQ